MDTSEFTTIDSATEEWRDIPGYEGIYQVSTWGYVRSLDRITSHGRVRKSQMRAQVNLSGRPRIRLSKSRVDTVYFVDEVVAATFLGFEHSSWLKVSHKDGDVRNSHVENLEVEHVLRKRDWSAQLQDGTCIEILLSDGFSTIIDQEDAELASVKWFCRGYNTRHPYASRQKSGLRTWAHLHRAVLERVIGHSLMEDEYVDHANGDTLDNRRSNLRVATKAQNQQNQRRRSDNTSGIKGVSWNNHKRKWHVRIHANNHDHHIGYFSTLKAARAAYAEAAMKLHGDFANLGEGGH